MIRFRRPSDVEVASFLDAQEGARFSYGAVGATAHDLPAGFNVHRSRARLGVGDACYERAVMAIRSWRMFDLGWVDARPDRSTIEAGTTVAVLVRYAGLWFLNACRIVYVVDEPHRYGFAYGTLPSHAESGEERFTVEREPDGSVAYEILAFSRPRLWAARAGYPLSRGLQKRFARDSMAAMEVACARSSSSIM